MHWSFTVFTLTIVAYTHALVVYSLYSNDCGLHQCIGRLQLTIVAYTNALVVYSLYSNDCGLHPCIGRSQSVP